MEQNSTNQSNKTNKISFTTEETGRTEESASFSFIAEPWKNLRGYQVGFSENLYVSINQRSTLSEIAASIQFENYSNNISDIRDKYRMGLIEQADELKKELPVIYPSVVYKENTTDKTIDNVLHYTGMVQIDYDYVDDIEELRKKVNAIPYTLLSFVSPKGKGLKVFVQTNNSDISNHKAFFNAVNESYNQLVGLESDKQVSNPNRACFISSDPNIYVSLAPKVFHFIPVKKEYVEHRSTENIIFTDNAIESCWDFTLNYEAYYKGNRNNFLFKFFNNANRWGIPYEEVIQYAHKSASDYPSFQLEQTAKSAYKYTEEFGSRTPFKYQNEEAVVSSVVAVQSKKNEENQINTYNYISDEVYNYLPKDIKELCNTYEQPQRDFLLCSLLTVLGASCKGATGVYADKIQNTNLYSLIIAPAASGKGVMGVAEEIGNMLDSYLRDQSERLFLPANVSGAKLGQLLQANNGYGLIVESEADTINDVMAQDWSMLSPLLRKAFQGEKISSARKSEDFEVEVKDPHLSMSITCTPNQVEKLFKSPENGLYSRFLIYFNQEKYVYRSPKPSKHIDNRKQLIKEIGSSVIQTYNYCQEKEPVVYMNDEQWDEITAFFENIVEEYRSEDMSVLGGVISRTSLIAFRIMMVLSVYKATNKHLQEVWVDAESFKASLLLIEHLITMNLKTIDLLPKNIGNSKFNNIESVILDELPKAFTSKEYIKLGNKYGLSERSCYYQLDKLKSHHLIQPNGSKGNYRKV